MVPGELLSSFTSQPRSISMDGVRKMAGTRQIKSLLLPNWFPCYLCNYDPFSTLPHGSERVISGLKSVPSNSSKPKVLSRVSEIHYSLAPAKHFSFYLDHSQHVPLSQQPLCKIHCAPAYLCSCSSVCLTCPYPLSTWQTAPPTHTHTYCSLKDQLKCPLL